MNLFHHEGPINRYGTIIADFIILNFIWILFSIPIFTIGASTTALYSVSTRRIFDKEGYLLSDFWKSFRINFIRATLFWLLSLALTALILINLQILISLELNPSLSAVLIAVQLVILIELIIASLYLYPIAARFEMSFCQTVKSAFFMANRHLLTSISAAAAGTLIIIAVLNFAPFFLVGMGLYAYVTSHLFIRVFRKYKPEIF